MKKYLFGLGAMLVGAGLMFVLMHGEVRADDMKELHCEEFEVTGVMSSLVNYCKVKDLTCVLYSGRGVSCVRGSMF
jgi:hypothetical protein